MSVPTAEDAEITSHALARFITKYPSAARAGCLLCATGFFVWVGFLFLNIHWGDGRRSH